MRAASREMRGKVKVSGKAVVRVDRVRSVVVRVEYNILVYMKKGGGS